MISIQKKSSAHEREDIGTIQAHKMVFGHEPSDDVTTTLWKFLTAGFLIITGESLTVSRNSQKSYLTLPAANSCRTPRPHG